MVLPVALTTLDDLRDQVGRELAVSDWFAVSQESIDRFADATGDDQWLHVDVERAALQSPYGATIAHGFFTLSLIGTLLRDAIVLEGVGMSVNYGLNRVRFTAPVIAGSRIRGRFVVASVEGSGESVKVVWNVTVERESGGKPGCVAECIVLYYRAMTTCIVLPAVREKSS
jgi:acyl dehydratase